MLRDIASFNSKLATSWMAAFDCGNFCNLRPLFIDYFSGFACNFLDWLAVKAGAEFRSVFFSVSICIYFAFATPNFSNIICHKLFNVIFFRNLRGFYVIFLRNSKGWLTHLHCYLHILCHFCTQFLDIGRVVSIEVNNKPVERATKGQEVCIKIESPPGDAPKMFGRHFDASDILVSKVWMLETAIFHHLSRVIVLNIVRNYIYNSSCCVVFSFVSYHSVISLVTFFFIVSCHVILLVSVLFC